MTGKNIFSLGNKVLIMITKRDVQEAINYLKKQCVPKEYVYLLPSPHPGKRLMIRGLIDCDTAALMAYNVLTGKKTVDDYPEMTEIDN